MPLSFFGSKSPHSEWDRILRLKTLNVTETYCYLHPYHPWRNRTNPLFDRASGRILDVKQKKADAIAYYEQRIAPVVYSGVSLFVVPSHDPEKHGSGIRRVVSSLLKRNLWTDQTENLYRTYWIEKSATGGSRNFQKQFDSLGLRNPEAVKGVRALVIDDVVTSGSSMAAAKQRLLDAGASKVYCLAIGKTSS